MYNKKNDVVNSILENHKDELNSIIGNYIAIKTVIDTLETIDEVIDIIKEGKEGEGENV